VSNISDLDFKGRNNFAFQPKGHWDEKSMADVLSTGISSLEKVILLILHHQPCQWSNPNFCLREQALMLYVPRG
jgi:hypothetical protein